MKYKGSKVQVLDLPGIIEGAAHGKGRGREVIAVARNADMILIVLDAGKEGLNRHREILEKELETVGIRLNQQPPDVTVTKKKTGGVRFASTVKLTKLGPDPEKVATQILREYKMSNADVLVREDITVDQLVDVVQGNCQYKPCLYLYNKVDTITIEEVDELARMPHSIVGSVNLRLNIGQADEDDLLKSKMWEYLGLTRIYTKRRGEFYSMGGWYCCVVVFFSVFLVGFGCVDTVVLTQQLSTTETFLNLSLPISSLVFSSTHAVTHHMLVSLCFRSHFHCFFFQRSTT